MKRFLEFCAQLKACETSEARCIFYSKLELIVPAGAYWYKGATLMSAAIDARSPLPNACRGQLELSKVLGTYLDDDNFYLLEGLWSWLRVGGKPETWVQWHKECLASPDWSVARFKLARTDHEGVS